MAHTCVEATVRFAAELGYEVTLVKDATADYSDEEMHAALDVNIPNYASAIVTTDEIVDDIIRGNLEDQVREPAVRRYSAHGPSLCPGESWGALDNAPPKMAF